VIAVLGLVAVGVFGNGLEARLDQAGTPHDVSAAIMAQRSKLAAVEPPASVAPAERVILVRMIHESFIDAFRVAMFICTALAVGGALCALVIDGKKVKPANGKQ
jgi:hypothetical protein